MINWRGSERKSQLPIPEIFSGDRKKIFKSSIRFDHVPAGALKSTSNEPLFQPDMLLHVRSTTCVVAGHRFSPLGTHAICSLKYWNSAHSPHFGPCFSVESDTLQLTEHFFKNTYTTVCHL
jgi:hypothetical protein